MATLAQPVKGPMRPNIASADIQLPAVRNFEQVDDEISATLGPSKGWFLGLGLSIAAMLVGAAAWTYQIYDGLGHAGYTPATVDGKVGFTPATR